jgi:hypothetical protein
MKDEADRYQDIRDAVRAIGRRDPEYLANVADSEFGLTSPCTTG